MSSSSAPNLDEPSSTELDSDPPSTFFCCDGCSMPFEAMFEGSTQAAACAATSFGLGATGHYGSSFDMTRFIRPPEAQAPLAPAGNLCDACLFLAMDNGSLAMISDRSNASARQSSPAELRSAIDDERRILIKHLNQRKSRLQQGE